MYYKDFRKLETWNNLSNEWLTNWKGIPTTTERKIFEMLEQLTETKYRRNYVYKEQIDEKCRLCKKKKETVRHILSNCDSLAEGLYITRHNSVLKVLYWWLLFNYQLENEWKPWNHEKQPEQVRSNKEITIMWNAKIYCDDVTNNNKPDLTVINHKEKKITIIEMSCPWDKNLEKKFLEKEKKNTKLSDNN